MKKENSDILRPKVVVLGAGFGGLTVARKLADKAVDVTIIDRTNHHLFQPLLYQVATCGLSPANIAAPVRGVLSHAKNIHVVLSEVLSVDTNARKVVTTDLDFDYDFLVVATGARHSYFGKPEWEKFAPGLKTLSDALELRKRILTAFEVAEKARDPAEREEAMTFVVVGGGPTGVEMAGAIMELARFALNKDFRNINTASAKVILLEGSPRLLGAFSQESSVKALEQLKQLGVDVRLQSVVQDMTETSLTVNGTPIRTRTMVWAAGNEGSPIAKTLGVDCDRSGRVFVSPQLGIPGHPEVFVIGDLAHAKDAKGYPLPGVSPVALQMGAYVAKEILRRSRKTEEPAPESEPFQYFDKGSMATIGRNRAVVEIGFIKMDGFLAWLGWLFVHLFFLIDFRNRLVVLFEWAWAYFTYQRGARLISGKMGDHPNLHSIPDPKKT